MFDKILGSTSNFVRSIAVVLVLLGSAPAEALNVIGLTPDSTYVEAGTDFTLDLTMVFDELTVGGGVEVGYDSAVLTFLSFSFDPAFTGNFGLQGPAAGSTVIPLEIGFGWFVGPGGGETGAHTVGQLMFRADATGPSTIVATSSSLLSPGPFFGPANLSSPMVVQFLSADIEIGTTSQNAVPEPGPALLTGFGLIGLAWLGGRVRPRI